MIMHLNGRSETSLARRNFLRKLSVRKLELKSLGPGDRLTAGFGFFGLFLDVFEDLL